MKNKKLHITSTKQIFKSNKIIPKNIYRMYA